MHHLTRKAMCSRKFLGQTPLFKGEWVPHQVSCPCTPFCSSHSNEHPAMTSSIFTELRLYELLPHLLVTCLRTLPVTPSALQP